jgi:aminopeptidase N
LISRSLALNRSRTLRDIRYALAFDVPEALPEPVRGRATISFAVTEPVDSLVLDFGGQLATLALDGAGADFGHADGHIVLNRAIPVGEHQLDLSFTAAGAPLNRREDFFYTLFVPARAHLVFPCFDQPDLKARFTLRLTLPDGWTAVSNTSQVLSNTNHAGAGSSRPTAVQFDETLPLPTYLFAFAAGRFSIETSGPGRRPMRIFHLDADGEQVLRNRDAIFDLHQSALEWLEDYTAQPEPFGKLDVVIIPSFQFAGMEHPGATYYNASALLLEPSATEHQRLNRASLIAHETSHLWFGDLVTMKWFDDVWLKEVFANFMAAKIVEPSFPGLNHELRFLLAHYPAAYSVDRTAGTHPIRQELAALEDAGDMYGPIIYHKAPIAMRELERVMTPERLREGLQAYLARFAFGAADWNDLVAILAAHSDVVIAAWSREWIETAGLPRPGPLKGAPTYRYGDVVLADDRRRSLLGSIELIEDPVVRGGSWIVLWEEMLGGRIEAAALFDVMLRELPSEPAEQIVHLVLGYLRELFWRFTGSQDRSAVASRMEACLRSGLASAETSTLKATWFGAIRSLTTCESGIEWLERIWRREERIEGLALGEADEAVLALELAVRSSGRDGLLEEQRRRFHGDERLARFEFVMPAASADQVTRDGFFEKLAEVRNRHHEPWVIEGLTYLNHPLRAAAALRYLRRSLDLLAEIRRTGDIFFPKSWLDATLGGHNSPEAAAIVRDYLQTAVVPHLRKLVLQSADNLFRASLGREGFGEASSPVVPPAGTGDNRGP